MSYLETLAQRRADSLGIVKAQPLQALQKVLEEMPVRCKNVEPKIKPDDEKMKPYYDQAAKNVLETLCAIEPAKLATAIGGLNPEELDTLMKFIYRGFSEKDYDYAVLLKAHEEVVKKAGNGPIIRTIHTRLVV